MKKLKTNLKILNELVEFRTSIAIITSVLTGTAYGYYEGKTFNPYLFMAMLATAICLDGAATVFNHYFDFKKAKLKEGYLYDVHNPISAYKLPGIVALLVGGALVGIAGLLGLIIVYFTSYVLIIVGLISAAIVYFYSAGKHPISYGPYGELVSGFFEGCIVFGIAFFIQTGTYTLNAFLCSLPIAIGISNIMLSNNICDVDEDIKNERRTLPIVIRQDNGVKLLYLNNFIMFSLNAVFILLRMIPMSMLVIYILVPVVLKNLNTFNFYRTKEKGFAFSLKNTILFNLLEFIGLYIWVIAYRMW